MDPPKTEGELSCSIRVSSSCFTRDTILCIIKLHVHSCDDMGTVLYTTMPKKALYNNTQYELLVSIDSIIAVSQMTKDLCAYLQYLPN
jgi:hypothetical protein